jgi:uncharacterized protein
MTLAALRRSSPPRRRAASMTSCLLRLRVGPAVAALAFMVVALVALLPAGTARAADAPRNAEGLVAVPSLARVTDLAGVLQPADRQALDGKLAAYETAHGSQIAIIVLPTTQPEPIADFTNRVGDAWKIGRRGVGDGVLITVAVDDRRVWISVARALEGAIPDAVATRISREVIAPRFRQGDFAGGLSAGLDALFRQIDGEGLPTPSGLPSGKVDAGEDVLGLLFVIVLVGIAIGATLRRIFGVPGALLAGGGAGAISATLLASMLLGGLAGVAVFVLSLMSGRGGGGGRVLGSRRGGGSIFVPGGWSGGHGGGSWGGGGGWSSGGGGDFSGGGGGSGW